MTGTAHALASARNLWDEITSLPHIAGQTAPAFTTDQVRGVDGRITHRVAVVADFAGTNGCDVTIVTVHRYTEDS